MASVLLEARPYRPFKSSEEYLEAMREDLAEWLNIMYPDLMINADNFMDRLDTGVALCKHANNVRQAAEDYLARRQARNKSMTRSMTSGLAGPILAMGNVHYLLAAKSGTFFARDNVSNFITWCRKSLKIFECLLFETDDLIMRKNEKHVILCLLEVARRGAKFGMLAPMLVQMERQIDREIAADNKANGVGCGTQTDFGNGNGTNTIATETEMFDTDTEDEDDEGPMLVYGPQPQIITNDLKSLDEMVRDLVEKCTCPSQFPMVRVSEGKYRIGDTKVLIFVRILRSHVMVRVGGGWDTLSHYLDKHDPCRCRAQHRSSVAARLIPRTNNQTNGIELHKAQVIYERSPPPARKITSFAPSTIGGGGTPNSGNNSHNPSAGSVLNNTLSPPSRARSRSRSPTPQRKFLNSIGNSNASNVNDYASIHDKSQSPLQNHVISSPSMIRRSMSPSPRRLVDFKKKQTSLDSGLICPSKNSMGVDGNQMPLTTQIENLTLGSETKTDSSGNGTLVVEGSNKFENISDNGSEISDEGYRSLGLIQPGGNNSSINNAQKRESLHSQTSVEDADCNGRLDHTSSDSQMSPSEEQSLTKTQENLDSDQVDSSLTPSPPNSQDSFNIADNSNNFEQSGIFITDEDITVDIASATGLRKTGFSDNLYSDDPITTFKKSLSKIPRSPVPARRRSVDNSSECGSEFSQRTGLPVLNRKQPVYRSVRKPTERKKAPVKDVTNTWSGRSTTPANSKKRPTVNCDTFTPPSNNNSGNGATNNGGSFPRSSSGRSSQIMYDKNGRRIKGSTSSLTTSPVKTGSTCTSPLAQQILEAAGSAKNDAQILEKMKQLLTMYSGNNGGNIGGSTTKLKKSDFDDFTTAWVHSNGTLDRASSCSPPTKVVSSKRNSSAASSCESTHSKDMSVITSPRRDRGLSRIPAPVRNNTELY